MAMVLCTIVGVVISLYIGLGITGTFDNDKDNPWKNN